MNIFFDPQFRNAYFVLVMGLGLVLLGSFATGLFIVGALYLLMLNPTISIAEIWRQSLKVYKRYPYLIALPVLYFLLLGTAFIGENNTVAVQKTAGYFYFLFIVPVAVAIYSLTPKFDFISLFSRGCRIGLLFVLPIAIIQLELLYIRPEGALGNALIFGQIMCLTSGVALLRSCDDLQYSAFLTVLPSVFGFVASTLTFARSMLPLVAMICIIVILYFKPKITDFKLNLRTSLIVVFVTFAGLMAASQSLYVQYLVKVRFIDPVVAIHEGRVDDESILLRLKMLDAGVEATKGSPLYGHGRQNIMSKVNEIVLADGGSALRVSHLHNDYLNHAVGAGLLGVAVLVICLFIPLLLSAGRWVGVGRRNAIYYATMLSFGYAYIAFFGPVFSHDIMTVFFIFSCVILLVTRLQGDDNLGALEMPDLGFGKPKAVTKLDG